jgi:hypothetical protein
MNQSDRNTSPNSSAAGCRFRSDWRYWTCTIHMRRRLTTAGLSIGQSSSCLYRLISRESIDRNRSVWESASAAATRFSSKYFRRFVPRIGTMSPLCRRSHASASQPEWAEGIVRVERIRSAGRSEVERFRRLLLGNYRHPSVFARDRR